MAERTIWRVELGGGVDARYEVLGDSPLAAAQRAWRADAGHVSHGERKSILVQVGGTFNDVEDDIPDSPEAELRSRVDDLASRVLTLESRSTTTVAGGR